MSLPGAIVPGRILRQPDAPLCSLDGRVYD